MKKNPEKLLLLIVIIVAALLTRFLYPNVSASPATTMQASLIAEASSTLMASSPPTTSLDSGNAFVDPITPFNTSSTSYYGETNTSNSVFTRFATTEVPTFDEASYLVADLTNGTILAANNPDLRWPTASITKLMTATLILDHLTMDTQITVTPQMFAVDPSEATLVVNDTYTVQDLLHVMLMPSSNVAAEAMADFYGRTQFIQEMNARAQTWNMTSTYFADPSGLSSANESSAHDMLILAQHVYENYPTIFSFTNTPSIMITELNTGKKVLVRSINTFAGTADFIGGKTGHTDEARDNLLSVFNDDGHPVIIIVLGVPNTPDRFNDTTKLLNWFTMNYH